MSETKLIRNEGKPLKVEYGGRDYFFNAGEEREVPADLADVCSYRHGHEGFKIVNLAHEAEEARKRGEIDAAKDAEDKIAAQAARDEAAAAVEAAKEALATAEARVADLRATEPPADEATAEPEAPQTFVCPSGDLATNDKTVYDAHLAEAHGLGGEPVPATPAVESPSADNPPVLESPSSEPVKES